MRVVNALSLPVFLLFSVPIMAGAIKGPGDPPPPVHELVQELEGDYSDFINQDPDIGPRFGFSMAMYGDTLAVGAPNARTGPGGTPTGVVFIFRLRSGRWQLEQRLFHNFSNVRECGYSVALDAFNLLIGCPGAGIPSNDAGSVRRFTRSSPSAMFEFDGNFSVGVQNNQRCGESVALIGAADSGSFPFAAVGCPGHNDGQGRVDIHFFCPLFFPCLPFWETGWNQVTVLSPPPGVPEEPRFGASLSFAQHAGDLMLAIGQPGFPGASKAPNGRAEVFKMGETVDDWSVDQTYDGATGSQLGFSVHLRGERLITGAPRRRVVIPSQPPIVIPVGGFSLATRNCMFNPEPQPPTCTWGSAQEFPGSPAVPQPVPQNRLGHAVHILATGAPGRVIAGEPWYPVTSMAGRARHYQRINGDWELNTEEHFHAAPLPAPSALGTSLAGNDAWLAIGAPGYVDSSDGPRGRVLVYAYDNSLFRDRFEGN